MSKLPSLFLRALVALLAAGIFYSTAAEAAAERIKDLASVAGVRDNQLVGYGLVVGLDGSGDQTTQTPFTVQSIINMLGNMGVALPPGTNQQLKNVAAVMVTATLPPFARPGQQLDVTVSSIGNAKSLRGGTLVMTPLKGVDGQVYAIAQGNMAVGGAGAQGGGASQVINHLSAGRIPGGATVERAVPTMLGEGETVEGITTGRHDPCGGIRATPIAEALLALVVMDHALRHRAQCADVAVPSGFGPRSA